MIKRVTYIQLITKYIRSYDQESGVPTMTKLITSRLFGLHLVRSQSLGCWRLASRRNYDLVKRMLRNIKREG